MNKYFCRPARITIATFILLVCQASSRPRANASAVPDISALAWMVGDWQTDSGERTSDEHWAGSAGGVMIGMSRTVAGDKLISFESLRIEQRQDGVFYLASVNGSCPATPFRSTRLDAQEAVFENPAHDFPKRIIYRKTSATEMTASVDAGEGAKSHTYTFHLKK
jgi:uncharacterized protein DUF6265